LSPVNTLKIQKHEIKNASVYTMATKISPMDGLPFPSVSTSLCFAIIILTCTTRP